MSKDRKVIVNCGSSCVSFASVSFSAKEATFENYIVKKLDYEPSDESAWIQALTTAVHNVTAANKLSGRTSVIIPGHTVLSKALNVAHVEASKRVQLIAFEAQQKLPYQLHELEWDSMEISDDGIETEALFFACKKQLIAAILHAFKGTSLKVESVRAASVLDQSTLSACPEMIDGPALMINVGSNSTNLTYLADDRFAIRNISIGGNFLTQSVADKLGQPFEQAEQLKLHFLNNTDNIKSDDPNRKHLIDCTQEFIRRLNQELTRSILNFRRQLGLGAPVKIALTGGGSLIDQLAVELSQYQKTCVERLDSAALIKLGPNVRIDQLTLGVSEIVGEALNAQQSKVEINLLPEMEQKQLTFAGQKPWLLAASLLLAAAPWPAYLGLKTATASAVDSKLALRSQIKPLLAAQAQLDAARSQAEIFHKALQDVQSVVGSKYNWIGLIADLQVGLNAIEDVWLDNLKIKRIAGTTADLENTPNYSILRGKMLVRESVSEQRVNQNILSSRINSLQSSFTKSKFVASAKSPVITWTSLRRGLNVLLFGLI